MARRTPGPRPPLDEAALDSLALRYVERFATTRFKLRAYLQRKIRERGWGGAAPPEPERIAERFAGQGYIDDAAYALAKAQSLAGRGFGRRRLVEKLRAAGVADEDGSAARDHAEREAVAAALRFAQRRRLGPFAREAAADPKARDKALGAMIRAGHGFALARTIIALAPGEEADCDALAALGGHGSG